MNAPGFSIFQGGESIHLDNSINRAEEEEDLEDKRRRHEEINHELQTAFNDLIDDEDNTIDNSKYQSDLIAPNADKSMIPNGFLYMGIPTKNDRQTENHIIQNINLHDEEMKKLRLLLDSKTHELENVTRIVQEEKKMREQIEKRLALSEAELERAIRSKKSHHELLVESKEKCSNLESTIQHLKSDIKNLETENSELIGKLETCQNMLADVQHKYNMVEKNILTNNDRNSELKIKQVEERHRAEITMMQAQLDSLSNKLDRKNLDLENMNSRYKSLQQSQETMLIEKSSKINELARELTEAQKQCQELMCKHDYSQENVRLQRLVVELQMQIQNMEGTIDKLRSRLEQANADLNAMDTIFQQNSDESFRRLSNAQGKFVGSTPISGVERSNNLKEELSRAMFNLKHKREEIREMQKTLDRKDNEIKNLKDEENKALVKISTCQEENTRLKNKLKLIEEELDELRAKTEEETNFKQIKETQMLNELMSLKEEKQILENKLQENNQSQLSKQEAEKAMADKAIELRILDSKVKDLQIDLEELKQERDSLKANFKRNEELQSDIERLKLRLEDSQKECDRLKNLYVQISNEKEAISIELKSVRKTEFCKELHEQKEKCASLNKALQLTELKCSELTKILESQKFSYEKDLAQLREQLEKEKADSYNSISKNTSNNCAKCIEYVAECTKLEIQILKLTSQCSIYQKEIDELNSELNEANNHIADLSDKIVLIDEREKLIVELKTKAQQFEEYIKTQSSSGASSGQGSKDKSVETSPELESKLNRRRIESKVRDEMAKIFAIEIRNSEQRYKVKIIQLEEELHDLRKTLQKINIELIQRQNEVQVLKHAILSEREKTEEIIAHKDREFNELIEKQNIILHKSRDELKSKTHRISELNRELDERNSQIEAERQSMKAVMTQWEEQQKKSDNIKYEWENKIDEMKKLHEAAIATWKTKYNSAKKTAVNYKRYAEDKEEHMIQEYNRIKSEYDASLAKIEIRMKEALERKKSETQEAIAAIDRKSAQSQPKSDGVFMS